jgi:hypothetical protein
MPEKLPSELQKLILEYADYKPEDKYKEFHNRAGYNNIVENTKMTAIVPGILLSYQILSWTSFKLPEPVAIAIGMGTTVPFTAPVALAVGAVTGLKDVSMFAKRKYQQRGAKEIFDADLLEKPSKKLKS